MKHSLVALILGLSTLVLTTACTTLENRRDMYCPQLVNGPYTRMLKDGIPKPTPVSGTINTTAQSDGKSVVR